jgi:4-amino-4-deoxy-L-arabinose transferase-like glycosyltransferase
VLFALLLRLGYSSRIASAVGLLAGLCTQIWPESKSPFDHHLETLGVLICVYQMVLFLEDRRRRQLWLAGVALGLAAITRVTTVLWLLPLTLFFVAASGHERLWKERGPAVIRNASWFGLVSSVPDGVNGTTLLVWVDFGGLRYGR